MNNYLCKTCNKDLSHLKWKRHQCSTCIFKNQYFGGLYWKVLKRDKNRCVDCHKSTKGIRGSNIHHKNHNHKDNRLGNLETLCISCHYKKRRLFCHDCGKKVIAANPRQKWCKVCGINQHKLTSLKCQARYWKKRSLTKYNWYINSIEKIEIKLRLRKEIQ